MTSQISHTQKSIIQFEIGYTQFLDPMGKIVQNLPEFTRDSEHLKILYRFLVRTRVFDTKAIALQRTGKLGTYPSTLGQEAIGVGIGSAMQSNDVLCPYYREYGAQFWRGVKMSEILLYWGGDERGSDFSDPRVKEDFPLCVPIGSQTLHAVGVATALKLRKQARVTVTTVGDGGTSRGDFYEAVNLAGAWQLPIVFVINNNQWAISLPRAKQTHAETLAQKGIAGGIFSEQVDGNDIIAVRYAVEEAIKRARSGLGPSVIEALSYRMSDHTTADDARRYRDAAEIEKYKALDPIKRFYQYLVDQNIWDKTKEEALQESVTKEVADAVYEYEHTSPLEPTAMFDFLYAKLPDALHREREEAAQLQRITTRD